MVVLRVMDKYSIVEVGVQTERVEVETLVVDVGVTHPVEDRRHVAAPVAGVHHDLLDSGVQWEGFLLHTAENI